MNYELNSCVRCGRCKALCPTYAEDVTEGMSARGRAVLMRSFHSGELRPSKKLDERIFSCMLCGACNKLCPVGINLTDAIYGVRERLRGVSKKRRLFSFGVGIGLKRLSMSFRILKFLEGINEILPAPKIRLFKTMNISLPDFPLREGTSVFRVSKPVGRVAVFAGCTVNFLYPQVGMSLIGSLNAMNYDVVLPKGEVCCGAPLLGLGLKEGAVEMAERNMNAFRKLNVEAVVGLCPTCISFIKNEYRKLIGDSVDNAVDVSQFFIDKIHDTGKTRQKTENKNLSSGFRHLGSVVYHDPCHSIYALDVSSEPRQILKSIGFNLTDSDKGCCGFGGTFRLLYEEISEGILDKRVEGYKNADMIVTSCPNCILQLRSKIKDRHVKHIIEIIQESLADKHYN